MICKITIFLRIFFNRKKFVKFEFSNLWYRLSDVTSERRLIQRTQALTPRDQGDASPDILPMVCLLRNPPEYLTFNGRSRGRFVGIHHCIKPPPVMLSCQNIVLLCFKVQYGDGAGNTVENSSVFFLIRMR